MYVGYLIHCLTLSRNSLRVISFDFRGRSSLLSLNSSKTKFENPEIRGLFRSSKCQNWHFLIQRLFSSRVINQDTWELRVGLGLRCECEDGDGNGDMSVKQLSKFYPWRHWLSPLIIWRQFSLAFQILWCLVVTGNAICQLCNWAPNLCEITWRGKNSNRILHWNERRHTPLDGYLTRLWGDKKLNISKLLTLKEIHSRDGYSCSYTHVHLRLDTVTTPNTGTGGTEQDMFIFIQKGHICLLVDTCNYLFRVHLFLENSQLSVT